MWSDEWCEMWCDVFWPKREPARMRSWAEMAKSRYALSSVCSASLHTLTARLEFTNPGERLGEPAELPVAFSATETQASTSMLLLHTWWSRQISIITSIITRAAQRTRRHRRGVRVCLCARMNTRLGDQDQDHWCEPDVRNVHINPEIIRKWFPPLAHDSLRLNNRSPTVQRNIITRAIIAVTQSYPIRVFYALWHARAACGRALFPTNSFLMRNCTKKSIPSRQIQADTETRPGEDRRCCFIQTRSDFWTNPVHRSERRGGAGRQLSHDYWLYIINPTPNTFIKTPYTLIITIWTICLMRVFPIIELKIHYK